MDTKKKIEEKNIVLSQQNIIPTVKHGIWGIISGWDWKPGDHRWKSEC